MPVFLQSLGDDVEQRAQETFVWEQFVSRLDSFVRGFCNKRKRQVECIPKKWLKGQAFAICNFGEKFGGCNEFT